MDTSVLNRPPCGGGKVPKRQRCRPARGARRCPESESKPGITSFTLEVDGETFALSPDKFGGTDYTWLSGPNTGYGFSSSPTPNWSLDEHRENIRDFLAQIDPTTGYIEDD
jgi:hypothetical protein